MKTATIRQVRNDFSTVLAWVQQGEEVTVLNRKKPVARICPLRAKEVAEIKMPDFAARAEALFGTQSTHLSDGVLEERRKNRW